MVYRLQKQASVLSAKLDLLLIQNRVLQSFKRYHNLKFGLGFGFLLFALEVPEGAISLLKLSRDYLSSHHISAKDVL